MPFPIRSSIHFLKSGKFASLPLKYVGAYIYTPKKNKALKGLKSVKMERWQLIPHPAEKSLIVSRLEGGYTLPEVFSAANLLLGDGIEKDGRQYYRCSNPKTGSHFFHVIKEKEGHQNAIYGLEVGN